MSEAVFEAIKLAAPAGCMIVETTWNGASFVSGVVNLFSPFRVVEIGSCSGFTSAYIAKALNANGRGEFVAYELEAVRADETRARLEKVWPGGAWEVVTGDFFANVKSDPIDLAFIDIDPKDSYIPAYEKIKDLMPDGAVIVAHDLDYDRRAVGALGDRLEADGWKTLGLHKERGFLVAVKS